MPFTKLPTRMRRLARTVPTAAWSLLAFACGMLVVIWLAVWQAIQTEGRSLELIARQEAENLAVVFEQNVLRSIGEVDRMMIFLRELHTRRDSGDDWHSLIKGRHTTDKQTMQIAVTDERGILIATSLQEKPPNPLDLSDRAHIRFHMATGHDVLFISAPVLGRVSNRWSVQLTRRIVGKNGELAGVMVVSLDAEHLSRAYGGIDLGAKGGLALLGSDDVIRSGTGHFAKQTGRALDEGYFTGKVLHEVDGTKVTLYEMGHHHRLTVTRRVAGYPLMVLVAGRDLAENSAWQAIRANYLWGGVGATGAVFLALLGALNRRRQHERRINHMARHDALTALANRVQFQEALDAAILSTRDIRPAALLLIDLDRFKAVNDTHGHPVGDGLLQQVAERIRANVRGFDLAARLGGDEFAVLQMGITSAADAEALASRLCALICEPFEVDGIRLEIGASIGISMLPVDGSNSADIVKAADLALYAAKFQGRGQHRLYDKGMLAAVDARASLENELRGAIERDELVLHYQPISDIATGKVTGYEALVRWRHRERGMIPPAQFIPVAEETGLIQQIGAWVLETACCEIAKRTESPIIAVNFSPVQFKDPLLINTVKRALELSGLDPRRLKVEITESTIMQKDSFVMRTLSELRDIGVQIAMDDFGTGYSSLSYLQSFPVNCIKIDRSFIQSLDSRGSTAIVRAITAMAAGLEMSTIAEGVETAEQLRQLATLGCNEAQGYYLSPPRPADDILPTRRDEERSDIVGDAVPSSIAA